jgi:uncharacterized protein YyaL (SSP411 family)
VDWYPWGEAAFAKAGKEGKPIFLSIGYSTCHWCHVMAHESFEDEAIATIMNAHFVCIKVDREERPDVDRVYMTYVQAATGSGGWPMSVWLTPDLKPFAGGTYYPPQARFGQPGFPNVLQAIAAAWQKDRGAIVGSADQVLRQLQQATMMQADDGAEPDASILDAGYRQIKASYDPHDGGFGGAPKFPRPVSLNFMLRYYFRTGVKDALDMTLVTLRKMAEGGIHDHVGGGFHRYSVDAGWHVPHFEKMLYDQAQLATSYLEAYQITHDTFYADVTRDILDYVLRDMTGKAGQFYSAEDADSPVPGSPANHAEGAFYVWEQREVAVVLGDGVAGVFCYCYGVEPKGNAPADPHGEFRNKNILILRRTVAEASEKFGMPPDAIRGLLAESLLKLREVRDRRPRPHRDDKTLTAWNGLMIGAFARAAQVLDEPRYLAAAERAAAFAEAQLFDAKNGKLLRCGRRGETAIEGFADDYAFLIQGLIDLYEASFAVKWLLWAIALQKQQDALFWDADGGGYFSTSGDDASVLLRIKEDYDGAEPSAGAIAAANLVRLSRMIGDTAFRERAGRVFALSAGRMRSMPSAMPQMLVAYEADLASPVQVVIAGKAGAQDTRALLREVHSRFLPNKFLVLADGTIGHEALGAGVAHIDGVRMIDGKATAYVCEGSVCQEPTSDVATLARLLKSERSVRRKP